MKEVQYLSDWFVRFLKNRDLYFKKIKNIEQREDLVIVEEKTKTVEYKLVPFTEDLKKLVGELNSDEHNGIVMYNNEGNFKAFMATWPQLVKVKNLIVYFINPFSKTEKKWMVYPMTHHRISEKESLKTGLRTMFETVETVSEEEVKKIIA